MHPQLTNLVDLQDVELRGNAPFEELLQVRVFALHVDYVDALDPAQGQVFHLAEEFVDVATRSRLSEVQI